MENSLCNWSYGTCAHANISRRKDEVDACSRKKSTVQVSDCQCDRGYEIQKVGLHQISIIQTRHEFFVKTANSASCVVKSNRTFDVMLNPHTSFQLNQHGIVFTVSVLVLYVSFL